MVRACVIEGLGAIVDVDGNGAGDAGKIAADHQYDTKFAESVRKAENEGSDEAGPREWKNHAEEGTEHGWHREWRRRRAGADRVIRKRR